MKQCWNVGMRVSLVSVMFIVLVRSATAQSTEMDRPTRLNQPEVSAVVDTPIIHYYAFDAGPGEVTILVAATHLLVNWELLDPNMRSMTEDSLYNGDTNEDQKMTKIKLIRKATVVLKVRSNIYSNGGGGTYRFRLGGAVDVGGEPWIATIPHVGILTIKMKDGSLKQIDLKDVVGVSVR
jgi:hypothetical protein